MQTAVANTASDKLRRQEVLGTGSGRGRGTQQPPATCTSDGERPLSKDALLDFQSVAKRLGIPARTLRDHAGRGLIPKAFKLNPPRGEWKIRRADFEEWLESRKAGR